MAKLNEQQHYQLGHSWLLLCGALALHVLDEALNDFLSVYNPTVENIREIFPLIPLPTFTFEIWLAGLVIAILLLAYLSRFAYQGKSWMRPLSYLFAIIMIGNGLLHLGGTILGNTWVPGVYSSPVLIAASIYLLWILYNTPIHAAGK